MLMARLCTVVSGMDTIDVSRGSWTVMDWSTCHGSVRVLWFVKYFQLRYCYACDMVAV